jgi:hypothetical protein
MKDSLVLHMTFMMTRVVVRSPCLVLLLDSSLPFHLVYSLLGFGEEVEDCH